jgi:hypothetical protein
MVKVLWARASKAVYQAMQEVIGKLGISPGLKSAACKLVGIKDRDMGDVLYFGIPLPSEELF